MGEGSCAVEGVAVLCAQQQSASCRIVIRFFISRCICVRLTELVRGACACIPASARLRDDLHCCLVRRVQRHSVLRVDHYSRTSTISSPIHLAAYFLAAGLCVGLVQHAHAHARAHAHTHNNNNNRKFDLRNLIRLSMASGIYLPDGCTVQGGHVETFRTRGSVRVAGAFSKSETAALSDSTNR